MVSITQVLSSIFIAYILYSIWSFYSLYQTQPCVPSVGALCLMPYLRHKPQLKFSVYTSTSEDLHAPKLNTVWTSKEFSCDDSFEKTVDVKVPLKTRKNGTLFAHVVLSDANRNSAWKIKKTSPLTTYAIPQAATFQLMGNGTQGKKDVPKFPESHWNSKLILNIVNEVVSIDRYQVNSDVAEHLVLSSPTEYLPILFLDEVSIRLKDLMPLNESSDVMPLKIVYSPISMGKLKFWWSMKQSMSFFKDAGFSQKDVDEVKNIFVDVNLYLLLLTFFVSAFHMLFDFLAFKNDISFWMKRKNMVGLSSRTMIWRCFSTFIIFLYLLDEQTSLLLLVPSGIGLLIEIWKLFKAFKVSFRWSGWKPKLEIGSAADNEADTEAFDAQAMKWLLYLLYPLVICGAIYSLVYTPHKSWYSWTIQSLANGVYAFGFIFMLPQLFINYKLKSVAHLPWKAFTYKAFNTFIDDVFAFIITMPTTHRLACFRDDIVFVIYLYQRWLYPVDKTRINEFGQVFDEKEETKIAEKKTK